MLRLGHITFVLLPLKPSIKYIYYMLEMILSNSLLLKVLLF